MLQAKFISSMEKPFLDAKFEDYPALSHLSFLHGEKLSFLLLVTEDELKDNWRRFIKPVVTGAFAPYTTMQLVWHVPSVFPASLRQKDEGYLRTTPGLYPDLLTPLQREGAVPCIYSQLYSVWVEIDVPADFPAGDYDFSLSLQDGEETTVLTLPLTLLHATLPKQTLTVTQWFHADCLADYYEVPIFSERHWEIMENFARMATKSGINMLLVPVFTPPLDTEIGGERPTVQLVGVRETGDGYAFDFTLLDRYLDMCLRVGIEYFEISHFFTQWGAAHAPKIMAGDKQIFGWDTDATGPEYTAFLRTFIPAFLSHMKVRGDDRRLYFHISDEPNEEHLSQYTASRATVADLLCGYPIMDALSSYEFYKRGVVDLPVPSNDHIEPFIEGGVKPLWTYYCCGQARGVSNRFFAMPGARTRCMGTQMFKYEVDGFLQWGYNFYYNQNSHDFVNPFADSCGHYFVQSGDTYSVYPGRGGVALPSIRLLQFRDGLQDMRAMQLCEVLIGHEATVAAIEDVVGEVRFSTCILEATALHRMREKINKIISEHT